MRPPILSWLSLLLLAALVLWGIFFCAPSAQAEPTRPSEPLPQSEKLKSIESSLSELLQIIEMLWQGLIAQEENLQISAQILAELQRRLEASKIEIVNLEKSLTASQTSSMNLQEELGKLQSLLNESEISLKGLSGTFESYKKEKQAEVDSVKVERDWWIGLSIGALGIAVLLGIWLIF